MLLRPPPSVDCSWQGLLQRGAAGGRPPPQQTCLRVTEAARPPRLADALPGACDPVVTLSMVRAATSCRASWNIVSHQGSGTEVQSVSSLAVGWLCGQCGRPRAYPHSFKLPKNNLLNGYHEAQATRQ